VNHAWPGHVSGAGDELGGVGAPQTAYIPCATTDPIVKHGAVGIERTFHILNLMSSSVRRRISRAACESGAMSAKEWK
jgi:hypothetical protein